MSAIINDAIRILTGAVNLSTGLSHPNDMNKARELFKTLHDEGEIILKSDVVSAALANHWNTEDADELGSLAQQIGDGKNPSITGGPWWADDIYEKLSGRK